MLRASDQFPNPALAVAVLERPDQPERYFDLARTPANVAGSRLRADLLVRRTLAAGGTLADLRQLVDSGAIWGTRHYLAVMTALRERGEPIALNIHAYERLIAGNPPSSAPSRATALRHLLSTDELRDAGAHRRVLVAAMPKSASTFLCSLLAEVTGRQMLSPHNWNDATGTNFDQLGFMRAYARAGVLHTHLDASARTLAMVRLLELRPVVQTRNIFDALASYLDHTEDRRYPGADFGALAPEQKRRVGILRMARHYVDMVASWSSAPAGVEVLWVDYDEVRRDPGDVVRRALSHVGIAVDASRIEAAVAASRPDGLSGRDRSRLRMNKGIPERGAMFTDDERAWVRTLYAEYPGVDFGRIDPQAP